MESADRTRVSAGEDDKKAISDMRTGLVILNALNEASPNVPGNEAALFSGCMKAILSLVGLYPRQDEAGRDSAWFCLRNAQSDCAKYVKTHWKEAGNFKALAVERPNSFGGRAPSDEAFNATATEVLIALLGCLHTTFERGAVRRSDYEPAISCIQWLAENPDPAVSAQARDILGKTMSAAPTGQKGGCFVATAAFGPQDCNVVLLREYRDRIMIRSSLGRCAVRFYYFLSPPLAHFIEVSNWRQSLARKCLTPFIIRAKRRLEKGENQKHESLAEDFRYREENQTKSRAPHGGSKSERY